MSDFTYEDYDNYFNNSGFLIPKLRAEIPLYRYRSNIDYIIDEIKKYYHNVGMIEGYTIYKKGTN